MESGAGNSSQNLNLHSLDDEEISCEIKLFSDNEDGSNQRNNHPIFFLKSNPLHVFSPS